MPDLPHTKLFARKISDFCRLRIDPALPPRDSTRIKEFLLCLIAQSQTPPRTARGYDWDEIALQCGLDRDALRGARAVIEPALDAIVRNTKNPTNRPTAKILTTQDPKPRPRRGRFSRQPEEKPSSAGHIGATDRSERQPATNRRKPGTKPRAVEEFPTPLFDDWLDPPTLGRRWSCTCAATATAIGTSTVPSFVMTKNLTIRPSATGCRDRRRPVAWRAWRS